MQMSTFGKEAGTDVAHERLFSPTINITEPGYVYVYLSNEETTPVDVYFDDLKVTQVKTPIVQTEDYYPFGLRFNEYVRDSSLPNKIKLFQGQEHVDDLGLNWDSFKWRNHQPDIGRFFNIDPLADKYIYNSPYSFSENHVTVHIELEGLEKVYVFDQQNNPNDKKLYTADVYVKENSGVVNGPFKGSSFPNNPATQNEVKSGEHKYNNKSGHSLGALKGLNLVNADGERRSPGTAPNGTDTEMTYVNVHSGVKPEDNSGQENRGSAGCLTIAPGQAEEFFKNFDFSNGTTGNAEGTITIFRGDSDESKKLKSDLQQKQEIQNFDTSPPTAKSDATAIRPPARKINLK